MYPLSLPSAQERVGQRAKAFANARVVDVTCRANNHIIGSAQPSVFLADRLMSLHLANHVVALVGCSEPDDVSYVRLPAQRVPLSLDSLDGL